MGWLQRLLGTGTAKQRVQEHQSEGAIAAENGGAGSAPITVRSQAGFAVLDVETTGLSPREHRVLDLAVVLVDGQGRVEHEWATRVHPQGPVGATHIHGLTYADVAGAPTFAQVAADLVGLLAGRALVAHNARFDLGFLRHEFGRAGWVWPTSAPVLCTLDASWHFLPHLERRRLLDCCWASGVALTDAHSALGDARATATLLASYLDPSFGLPPLPEHRAVLAEAARVIWPTAPGQGSVVHPDAPRRARSEPEARRVAAVRGFARPLRVATLLERFTLVDAVEDGAPDGTLSYLELLVEVLEDGQVSDAEQQALSDVIELYELSAANVSAAHRGFVRALAREALEDGVLARAERAELHHIADLLAVPTDDVRDLLDGEEEARLAALSANLVPLPREWRHGLPLRVGHRVVFTGCDETQRQRLEERAKAAGVRVTGNVSRRTAMLVTDGSFSGTKAAAAAELGTRVVHPDTFAILLDHLQPVRDAVGTPTPRPTSFVSPAETRSSVTPTSATMPNGVRPPAAVVRAWAQHHGMDVGVRGRLSSEVWDAYVKAHYGTAVVAN
jgi:DNA polymerase-3 subunit epsilon